MNSVLILNVTSFFAAFSAASRYLYDVEASPIFPSRVSHTT